VAERLALADAQLAELGDDRGALRVGGFPSAMATLVPAAIATVVPQRVQAVEGTLEQLAAGVTDGSLHVAVLFQDAAEPAREHPGLRRHELLDEPFVITVGPEHRLARRRTVHLRELAHDTWIAPSARGIVRNACVAAGFEPDIAFVARDVLAIRALVAAGLGVTLTPRLIAGHLHGAHVLDLRDEAPRRALYALTPHTGTRRAAREFLDALRAAV
jgi:DNA-binding transcriptional LysR family regulator